MLLFGFTERPARATVREWPLLSDFWMAALGRSGIPCALFRVTRLARRSWDKLLCAKECVTTHPPNGLAPKMDGAKAGDRYQTIVAIALQSVPCVYVRRGADCETHGDGIGRGETGLDRSTGTANLHTKILDFRGFYSNMILNLRGETPRPIRNFPESLSQRILVGIILVGRLGVRAATSLTLAGARLPAVKLPFFGGKDPQAKAKAKCMRALEGFWETHNIIVRIPLQGTPFLTISCWMDQGPLRLPPSGPKIEHGRRRDLHSNILY